MNWDITKTAKWAQGNGVARYPATPSNPRRRMAELAGKLNKSGLQLPAPSKKEQRAKRHDGDQKRARR